MSVPSLFVSGNFSVQYLRGISYSFLWKLCSSACQLWIVQSAVHCLHPNVHWGEVEECAPPRECARVWPWRPPQWAACAVPQTAQVLPTSNFFNISAPDCTSTPNLFKILATLGCCHLQFAWGCYKLSEIITTFFFKLNNSFPFLKFPISGLLIFKLYTSWAAPYFVVCESVRLWGIGNTRGAFFAWRAHILSWPRIMCSQVRNLNFLEPSREMP